jgi:hypothetical protein
MPREKSYSFIISATIAPFLRAFIVSSFAPGCRTSADDSDAIAPFDVNDHEKPLCLRSPHDYEPDLVERVGGEQVTAERKMEGIA